MIKKIGIIVVLVFGCSIALNAQSIDTVNSYIDQDPRIDSLVQLHKQVNEVFVNHEEHDGINGYRVQLSFDSGNNSKSNVSQLKNGFERRYPQVKAYLIFREPYYKLRVGDFRTKLEAEGFLKRISSRYPSAFVVRTKIKFPTI